MILPFTVLRHLDCVLARTKAEVLNEHAAKQTACIAFEHFVKRKAGLDFYNVSSLDLGQGQLINAAMDAEAAHALMSRQTLQSAATQRDLLTIALREGKLWERLRARAASGTVP